MEMKAGRMAKMMTNASLPKSAAQVLHMSSFCPRAGNAGSPSCCEEQAAEAVQEGKGQEEKDGGSCTHAKRRRGC